MSERLADGVWLVRLPFPRRGPIEATNCYVFVGSDGGAHLVDPGWDTDESLAHLEAGLADAGLSLADVRASVATHLHPDHLGLAGRLRAERGIPIALHRAELAALTRPRDPDPEGALDRWRVPEERRAELRRAFGMRAEAPGVAGDIALEDGERLDIAGRDVVVVHTPGHTAGSICLHDRAEDLLLTGDHVLPIINPGLGLGGFAPEDDPIGIALASYERIAGFEGAEVLPGHGDRLPSVAVRAGQIADRHRRRSAEIAAIADADPGASVWEVAARVAWTDGWDNLIPFLRLSAITQTELHLRHLGRATLEG